MVAGMHLFALAATVASALAAPASTAAGSCTTVTRTAKFDHLPTGTLSPTVDHNGLQYSGWEVVDAADTVFAAHSGHKILHLADRTGIISPTDKGQYYNDKGTPARPSFYFGCQRGAAAKDCGFAKVYDVPGQTKYGGFFNSTEYPNTLEAAGGIESINAKKTTWTLDTALGAQAPRALHLYIDSYRFTLTNCQT